jgi:hypothetical protein
MTVIYMDEVDKDLLLEGCDVEQIGKNSYIIHD